MSTFRYRLIALAMFASLIGCSLEVRGQSHVTGNVDVLTLEQAVALALRDNPRIKSATIDVNRSIEQFAGSQTRRLPSFSLEVIGSQQLTPINFTFERGVF